VVGTRWTHVLVQTGNAASNSVATQKLQGGAVRLDDVKIEDPRGVFQSEGPHVLRVGRRAVTVIGVAGTPS